MGLGYDGGALVFAAGLAALAAAYHWTDVSRAFLFWAAFILTRPLGATVGDFHRYWLPIHVSLERFFVLGGLSQDGGSSRINMMDLTAHRTRYRLIGVVVLRSIFGGEALNS